MKLKTSKLVDVLNRLEKSICYHFPEFIEISNDYYWNIQDDDICDPYKDTKDLEITLGQLSFDLEDLLSEEEISSYSLAKIAVLLRIIGKENFWLK